MASAEEIKEAAQTIIRRSSDLFILSTVDEDNRPQSRYMGAMVVDGEFEILMVTHRESRKVAQIKKNAYAQLVFASSDRSRVVTLSGQASLGEPIEKKQEVWEKIPGLSYHFEGYTSPDFCVIRFKTWVIEIVTPRLRYEPLRLELS